MATTQDSHTHGNATVNAMLRNGTVRLSLTPEHGEEFVSKYTPEKARRMATNIRDVPDWTLRFTRPKSVADALETEADRIES